MNKSELVAAVAHKTGLTKKDAGNAVEAMFETVSEALADGVKVRLIGFGTFDTRKRKVREGRNPGTGEIITIPASIVPVFKPGKELREKVKY